MVPGGKSTGVIILSKIGRSRGYFLRAVMARVEMEPRISEWQKRISWWDMQDILRHGYQTDRDYIKAGGVNLWSLRNLWFRGRE